MLEFKGKYNSAKVFNENVDKESIQQVHSLLNNINFQDSKIRYMPDIHVGKGCTIGTTMTITDKIVPNFVGVDIGCGVLFAKLKTKDLDFAKLDKFIKANIPHGFAINAEAQAPNTTKGIIENLHCKDEVDQNRAYKSIGTLGGGNHFIEVGKDTEGCLYLLIHSGSRHLGKQVCDYYQNLAHLTLSANEKDKSTQLTKKLKKKKKSNVPKVDAYLEGELMKKYLHDMKQTQKYAKLNRKVILERISEGLDLEIEQTHETVHNYIDLENMILRKGAVSAQTDEILIIPINMAYGSLLCRGKGNEDWNYSTCHGAGRLMSRREAKSKINLKDYFTVMEGVFSTCVGAATLDEAPKAYKPVANIIANIQDSVDVIDVLKAVYNFKSS